VKLGRVVGTVVSTINVPAFDGRTLLLCDLLDPSGRPAGGSLIAVDTVGAGAGETVLILDEGNSARQVLAAPGVPIRTLVVGIVDAVTDGSAVVTLGEGLAVPASAVATPRVARPTNRAARAPARPRRPR
jgi:microcompartment protein CcmK/EutM